MNFSWPGPKSRCRLRLKQRLKRSVPQGRKFIRCRCLPVFRRPRRCTSASWPTARPKPIASNLRIMRPNTLRESPNSSAKGSRSAPAIWKRRLAHQRRFAADMAALFATGKATGETSDLILVMPATVTPAPARLDTTGDPRFNAPWTYAGLPVVTIPCGQSDEGLPIGLQLVGPCNGEEKLLAAAAWCEKVLAGA